MDALQMFKERARLTSNCNIYCTACRLGPNHNGRDMNCTDFQRNHPEEYVETVEQWSKECPKQTNLSKLLKAFPNARIGEDGIPADICPSMLGLKDVTNCMSVKCVECWNRETEEK